MRWRSNGSPGLAMSFYRGRKDRHRSAIAAMRCCWRVVFTRRWYASTRIFLPRRGRKSGASYGKRKRPLSSRKTAACTHLIEKVPFEVANVDARIVAFEGRHDTLSDEFGTLSGEFEALRQSNVALIQSSEELTRTLLLLLNQQGTQPESTE